MVPIPLTAAESDEQSLEEVCHEFGLVGVKIKAADLVAEINYRQKVKYQQAMRRQILAAKTQGDRRVMRDDKGSAIGEVAFQLDQYFHVQQELRRPGCMSDPDYVRDMLRNHPECRVKSRSDRLTIVRPEFGAKSSKPARQGVHGRRGRWAA